MNTSSFASTEVNECLLGQHTCDSNAVCADTFAGFTCTCVDGYSGSGQLRDCEGENLGLLQVNLASFQPSVSGGGGGVMHAETFT